MGKRYKIRRIKVYTRNSERVTELMDMGYKLISMSYWLNWPDTGANYILQDRWF